MDYTFNNVNQTSLPVAPIKAMQFGHALQRILQCIAYCNPTFGPPLLTKLDLANGYYRILLIPDAILQLAVVLPSDGLQEALIGLPLSLPMGWSQSPPYFCAFTETCADMANTYPLAHWTHPYDSAVPSPADSAKQYSYANSALFPFLMSPPPHPVQHTDIYINDFMILGQQPLISTAMNTLLHHFHTVIRDVPHSPR
jgi:hypothetical protein